MVMSMRSVPSVFVLVLVSRLRARSALAADLAATRCAALVLELSLAFARASLDADNGQVDASRDRVPAQVRACASAVVLDACCEASLGLRKAGVVVRVPEWAREVDRVYPAEHGCSPPFGCGPFTTRLFFFAFACGHEQFGAFGSFETSFCGLFFGRVLFAVALLRASEAAAFMRAGGLLLTAAARAQCERGDGSEDCHDALHRNGQT
jgi:hypothetical protein